MSKINIFWFRRDLRLEDNHGLYRALSAGLPVLPVFIYDREILDKLEGKPDARVTFIYREVVKLKHDLETVGSSLLVKYGVPSEIFSDLLAEYDVRAIYTNHDYEPYARKRDEHISQILAIQGIDLFTFKDQVIFEKDDVLKDNGDPYTIFTPYLKRWRDLYSKKGGDSFPSEKLKEFFFKTLPFEMTSQELIPFISNTYLFPTREFNESLISNYHVTRDFPFLDGTTRLGVHLRFGTICIRRLIETASRLNQVFLNELVWREFYMMILWHFPHVAERSFKPSYDQIQWRNNEAEFAAWCEGRTGYPMVDAGMRELNATGFMHNRLRMVTASFLSKHLLIDWRWGEAYFAGKLLDFELSSNNGGWQWAAGTGCDAAPYFRVFNPDLQMQRFDPDHRYIRRWVPECKEKYYPERIVDHSAARNAAISAYKKALHD
jgi:deoxyribodipyrimidine photo-lyase